MVQGRASSLVRVDGRNHVAGDLLGGGAADRARAGLVGGHAAHAAAADDAGCAEGLADEGGAEVLAADGARGENPAGGVAVHLAHLHDVGQVGGGRGKYGAVDLDLVGGEALDDILVGLRDELKLALRGMRWNL